jgi:NADH-quinone oxidoreductase subunit J
MILIVFVAFAAILVVSSLFVILNRSPVTSALSLVLAFCALAAIYLLLHAEFIGLVQIVVYAGAIMVLFLFVIMYLNLGKDVESGVTILLRRGLGWLLGAVLVAEGVLLLARGWAPGPTSPSTSLLGPAAPAAPGLGNTQQVGLLLYSRYLFPFEVTSLVLLVAMVGVIVIAKGRRAAPPPAAGSAAADAAGAEAPPPASSAAPADAPTEGA